MAMHKIPMLGNALTLYGRAMADREIAESMDAHFDGGEFSGPAHARQALRFWRQQFRLFRARTGLSRSYARRIINQNSRAIDRIIEMRWREVSS